MGHEEMSPKQETVSKAFQTVDESMEALGAFFAGKSPNFYDRYDNAELAQAEREMAKRLGTDKVLLYNSGMSAISSVLENLNLASGDVLLYSPYVYDESRMYIENLRNLGIRCIEMDPGDTQGLQKLIEQHHPRAIYAETMANNPKMQALDTQTLFKTAEEMNAKFKPKTFDEAIKERLVKTPWINDWVGKLAASAEDDKIDRKTIWGKIDAVLTAIAHWQGMTTAPNFHMDQKALLNKLTQFFGEARERITEDKAVMGIKGLVDDLKGMDFPVGRNKLSELVLIIERAWDVSRQKPMTIILDNTIPTETIKDMGADIKKTKAPVIIVDSGTKFMAKDKATMGIVYTNDKKIMEGLYNWRAVDGGYLPRPSVERIPNVSKEEFDARNKNIMANGKKLAEAFASVVGRGDIASVSHPNLPGHPSYEYVSQHMPNGSVAVFYVECAKPAAEVCRKLEKLGLAGKIEYGGSFAFEKTRFGVFDPSGKSTSLRIAAGNESPADIEAICKIIESL